MFTVFTFTHETMKVDSEDTCRNCDGASRRYHRIVAKFGSTHIEGDWVPHTAVARLDAAGRDLFAVVSDYESVFPTNTSLTIKVVCEDCDGFGCHTCDDEGVVPVTIATSLY